LHPRFLGQIYKLETRNLTKIASPSDATLRLDLPFRMRQLNSDFGRFVVVQTHDRLNSNPAFADIQSNAAIAFAQFDVGQRSNRLPRMCAPVWRKSLATEMGRGLGHLLAVRLIFTRREGKPPSDAYSPGIICLLFNELQRRRAGKCRKLQHRELVLSGLGSIEFQG
jgi:hypothetical protein